MGTSKQRCISLMSILLLVNLIIPGPALAWERGQGRAAAAASAAEFGFSGSLNMDLSSAGRSVSASSLGLTTPVSINVGGTVRTVGLNDMLTPAELMAVMQVLNGGVQSLKLGADGNAVRGRFSLAPSFAAQLTGLVIPQGVKLVQDFGTLASLSFTGDLVNAGKIFAFSSNAAQTSATFGAQNIFNQSTGVITSMTDGRVGGWNAVENLGMSLNAVDNLINEGRIISAGDLNLSAGGSITNAGLAGSAPALMQSMGNLNVWSSNVVNSGVIASRGGNVNFNAANSAVMNINNLSGQIYSQSGVINLRDANYLGAANTNLFGGDVFSRELNLNTGNGVTNVDVEHLTGVVNSTGYGAHVVASTSNLQIGDIDLVDPTFYNTNGDITITGNISVNEALTIVASKDILANATAITLKTQDGNGQGHSISLIAGAQIDVSECSGCSPSSQVNTIDPAGNVLPSGKTIKITGGSATGGNIDLTNATSLTIDSSSTASGLDAGDINLVAFRRDSYTSTGRILLSANSNLYAKSVGSAEGGKVTVLSGSNLEATAIQLGNVNNTGGTQKGNEIFISTAPPSVGDGVTVHSDGSLGSSFIDGPHTGEGTKNVVLLGKISGSGDVNFNATHIYFGSNGEVNADYSGAKINITGEYIVVGDGKTNGTLSGDTINFNGGSEGIVVSVKAINVAKSLNFISPDSTVNLEASLLSGAGSISAEAKDVFIDIPYVGIRLNTIEASNSIVIQSNGDITQVAGGQLISPNLTLKSQNGHIGQFNAPMNFASSKTTPGVVMLVAKGGGSVYLTNKLAGDDVVFDNTSADNVSGSWSTFELKTQGSIWAVDSREAIRSSSITLVTTQGDIGTSVLKPLAFGAYGGPSSVTLLAQASGSVWLKDPRANEQVYLSVDNVSNAGTMFSLEAAGSISGGELLQSYGCGCLGGPPPILQTSTPNLYSGQDQFNVTGSICCGSANQCCAPVKLSKIESPSVRLVATGGDIGKNKQLPISISSGEAAGGTVQLLAQASGSVFLTDKVSLDTVQFGSGENASKAGVEFFLSTKGDIVSGSEGVNIIGKSIALNTTVGDIGSASRALSIASSATSPGKLLLTAKAGGSVWLTDELLWDKVSFAKLTIEYDKLPHPNLQTSIIIFLPGTPTPTAYTSSMVSGAGTSFELRTKGDIVAESIDTLLVSPAITLVTTNGNIGNAQSRLAIASHLPGESGSSIMILQNLGALTIGGNHSLVTQTPVTQVTGTLNLVAQATGSVWLADNVFGDQVQFDNSTTDKISGAGNVFSLRASGNITAKLPSVAIESYSLNLFARGNIGSGAMDPLNVFVAGGASNFKADADGSVWINQVACVVCIFAGGGGGGADPLSLISLDLTNPEIVNFIVDQQANNLLGGTLIIENGVAVGGNLIVNPDNLPDSLAALNIPKGVTVEFNGFDRSDNVLNITLGPDSSSSYVVIEGTGIFTGSPEAMMSIDNLGASKPLLVVSRTGLLSTESKLYILGHNGDMLVNGGITNTSSDGLVSLHLVNGSRGNIVLDGNVGSGITNLQINLDRGELIQRGGTVVANSLIIHTVTNVGTAIAPFRTAVANLSVNAVGDKSIVNVRNVGDLTLNNSSSTRAFSLANSGSFAVGDVSTTDGAITLKTVGGTLHVLESAEISATGGSLTLLNASPVNPSIVIGTSAGLSASGKGKVSVNILIGGMPMSLRKGTTPANVHVNGNGAFFGARGITANSPLNILTAFNQNIIFNTGRAPASAIVLDGGVSISATKVSVTVADELSAESVIDTGDFDELESESLVDLSESQGQS